MSRYKVHRKPRPTFAFVVDGETEIWYLQMLKRNERSLNVNVKPEIPQKKSIGDQFKLVVDLSGREYVKIFWIVDLDTVIKESREAKDGKKTPMQEFVEFRQIIDREYHNVSVIVNNPCLEFWFLLHFDHANTYFTSCANVESALKKCLAGYQKSRTYFTKQDNDIYLRLKPHLNTAMRKAVGIGEFDGDNKNKAISEMYRLFMTDEFKDALTSVSTVKV
ncbi:MAG: RloB domain-containing protein [Flavobacteriales bacterium]|nr:MAG: RloB domain-containing protein [Flavobacteriales bacterium]